MNMSMKLTAATAALCSAMIVTACNKSSGSSAGTSATPTALNGTTLSCSSSGKNAYTTYGSAAFVSVNQKIFANVNSELTAHSTANLGNSFNLVGSGNPASTADGSAAFQGKLAAFLVYAYGGPSSITYTDNVMYSGVQNMTTAHTGLGITTAQYNYFVTSIVVPALTSAGVPSGDVSSCFAPVLTDPTFMASIVGQ